jgi:2-polyprenyl-3-methyl-5-hydroxy-6-metoxy-1,4-benzoquinol methylase
MEPKSMVHALEQIHDLLKPGGHLIDVHPIGKPVKFIRPLNGYEHFIGDVQETDDYIEYRQADEALETAVSKGLFQVNETKEFDFHTYADSFDNLKTFLEENWSDAVILDEVIAEAQKLDKEHGKHTVFLREQTRLTVLKTVSKNR